MTIQSLFLKSTNSTKNGLLPAQTVPHQNYHSSFLKVFSLYLGHNFKQRYKIKNIDLTEWFLDETALFLPLVAVVIVLVK